MAYFGAHANRRIVSSSLLERAQGGRRLFPLVFAMAAVFWATSCTLLAQSPYLLSKSRIHSLEKGHGLLVSHDGQVPYQRWRIPEWNQKMAHIWVVGSHDFRKKDSLELILYFHGMHSKDYYRAFRSELEAVAKKRQSRPFLFVGFVDTPFARSKSRSKHRWKSLVPDPDSRPKKLFRIVNRVYRAFKKRFPHVKKSKTKIVLTGFSGGGRVLSSVGKWLARSPKDDRFAKAFRARLSKIVYFDCWFDPADLKTVPALLAANPRMKIVGTVHMKKPKKHAKILTTKLKLRKLRRRNRSVGLGGRFVIFRNKSHWDAMISRLKQALEV